MNVDYYKAESQTYERSNILTARTKRLCSNLTSPSNHAEKPLACTVQLLRLFRSHRMDVAAYLTFA